MHLDLRMALGLEPLDDREIDRGETAQESGEGRLVPAPQFVDQCPAPSGGDQHLRRPGLAMLERVLAGLVDLEGMMGVLEGGYRQAPALQFGNEPDQKGGFPRAAPACQSDHTHGECLTNETARRPAASGRLSWHAPLITRPAPYESRAAVRSPSSRVPARPRACDGSSPRRDRPRRTPWRRRPPPCRANRYRCG